MSTVRSTTSPKDDTTEKMQDHRVFIMPIKWGNVIFLSIIHLLAVYGLYYCIFLHPLYRLTVLFHLIYGYWGGFGVTGGAHRLWTHRSYRAKTPLKIILAFGHMCAGMNPIFDWVRDHRVHHRFSDTDADPHNANRGLFFSHCGWLLQKKHPEVIRRGREIHMNDISSDPVVAFQEKYFIVLMPLLCIVLPTLVAPLGWGESWTGSFLLSMVRWVTTINIVWSVNSFAHTFGDKPYNKKIFPAQNIIVSIFGMGEGWHNYHHVFPWDYKTAEIPYYFNLTTILINSFACIGWAYDMKQASQKLIQQSVINSGDGTYQWASQSEKRDTQMATINQKPLENDDRLTGRQTIKWTNVILLTAIHVLGLYGWKVMILDSRIFTFIWCVIFAYFSGLGVTAGAHRLWTHKSYKAKLPLRIILALEYCTAGMNPIFEWARDHRIHHRFSETDADPHNAKRGLFFAHCGWLMQKKHSEVIRLGREVDMSDIKADPVVSFQLKYFKILFMVCCFVVPTWVPCFFWNETLWNSAFCNIARWVTCLNIIWSVNSFAHIFGNRPYNRNINPAENLVVSILALGEGWHNYHHTFPWDYKTGEFGFYGTNLTTAYIDMFAKIGWAYDLKLPAKELVQEIVKKSGDGSYHNHSPNTETIEDIYNENEQKSKSM